MLSSATSLSSPMHCMLFVNSPWMLHIAYAILPKCHPWWMKGLPPHMGHSRQGITSLALQLKATQLSVSKLESIGSSIRWRPAKRRCMLQGEQAGIQLSVNHMLFEDLDGMEWVNQNQISQKKSGIWSQWNLAPAIVMYSGPCNLAYWAGLPVNKFIPLYRQTLLLEIYAVTNHIMKDTASVDLSLWAWHVSLASTAHHLSCLA